MPDRRPADADVALLLGLPVTDRTEAEAFIRRLADLGLGYHFDDGAVDCLAGNGLVTRRVAERIDLRIDACYDAWRLSGADLRHDCPIGCLLAAEGL